MNAVYDAFGRRVAWQTMRFVYDPAGRILEVSNRTSGLWWGDLVWVEGELLGRVESTGAVGVPAAIPPAIARLLPRDPSAWLLAAGGAGSLVFVVLAARRRSPRLAWAGAGSAALTLLGLACVPTGLDFYWIVTDQIGFPVAMTNTPATPSQAKVIWRASYEPFGLATEELDPDGDGKQVRMPMRFPGQWWDYAANLHYNFFRTYDPATGRYLEADPIGQVGGLNLYAFARSQPTGLTDPLGLDVTNNTNRTIWVKPERSNTPVPVTPGSKYIGNQDGLSDPARPDEVFKTIGDEVPFVGDVRVDATVNPDGTVTTTPRNEGISEELAELYQWLQGGWRGNDFAEKNADWLPLFEKSRERSSHRGVCPSNVARATL